MGSDRFSSLPAELVCGILDFLDSPKDLFSVLRASLYIHGAFTTSREHVLRQVARNGFKSTALSAAITAVRFPRADNSEPMTPQDQDHAIHRNKKRFSFLVELLERAKAGRQRGPTLDESVGLCSLLSSFEAFARDCSSQFLATAEWELARKSDPGVPQNVSPGLLQGPISLSQTELGRLQRAFVRYTTFQSVIHAMPHDTRSEGRLSPQVIASLFVYFTPWEVEEIACVHQYIVRWLRRILDEVEDDFVESVAAAEGPSRLRFLNKTTADLDDSDLEDPFVCNDECELGPDRVTWQLFDSTDVAFPSTVMFLKSQKQLQPALIENLATLPPEWFRTLVESSNPQRRNMINHNFQTKNDKIGEALCIRTPPLGCRHFQAEYQGWKSGQQLEFEGDDLQKRNFAWLWVHQMKPYPGYNDNCDTDLRAWGYVFWDKDRLDQMRLLEGTWSARYSHAPPAGYQEKSRPSAQERLRDLGLA
jgi:hypothetical protein